MVQQALERLEQDVRAAGREEMYAGCRELLLGESRVRHVCANRGRAELTEGTLKVQVHRLRRRLRELVLDEIEQTGAVGDDAEAELRYLLIDSEEPLRVTSPDEFFRRASGARSGE